MVYMPKPEGNLRRWFSPSTGDVTQVVKTLGGHFNPPNHLSNYKYVAPNWPPTCEPPVSVSSALTTVPSQISLY